MPIKGFELCRRWFAFEFGGMKSNTVRGIAGVWGVAVLA